MWFPSESLWYKSLLCAHLENSLLREAFKFSLILIFYSTLSVIFSFLPMYALVISNRQLYISLHNELRNPEFLEYQLSRIYHLLWGHFVLFLCGRSGQKTVWSLWFPFSSFWCQDFKCFMDWAAFLDPACVRIALKQSLVLLRSLIGFISSILLFSWIVIAFGI